jgi:rhomboid protease GluP
VNQIPAPPLDSEPVPAPRMMRVPLPAAVPTAMYVLLGLTIMIYLLQLGSVFVFGYAVYDLDWLELYGARINSAIRAGELWRFISPVFLHASIPHVFFNMYALFTLGSMLERHFGHGRFLLLYFLGGFSGNVFSFLFTGENGYSVGASTAIFGLAAAEGIFLYQNRKLFGEQAKRLIGNILFIVVVNLLIGLAPGIDNWGHVGGLLGGAIFSWFAGPRWEVEGLFPELRLADGREFRDVVLGGGAVIILFSALAVWGLFFPLSS